MAAGNGGRETEALRERAESPHHPLSGIRLPLSPRCLYLEAEDQEVTVLESELKASSED